MPAGGWSARAGRGVRARKSRTRALAPPGRVGTLGAIKADRGDLGVIPGSMGARSYIVAGKANPACWMSCSHGAGRRHSRTQAKKLFTSADLASRMAGKVWLSGRAHCPAQPIKKGQGK